MLDLRILVTVLSFCVAALTIFLVPAAYFGDKNDVWTKRLIVIGSIAALIFSVELVRWSF